MTPAERILAQRQAQRLRWVELAPASDGKPARRVQITRPTETEQPALLQRKGDGFQWSADIEHVKRFVVGWDGFTEADLVGAAGGDQPVPFSAALWADVCADSSDTTTTVAAALLAFLADYHRTLEADAKN